MTDSSNGVIWVYTTKLESTFRKVRDIQDFIKTYGRAPLSTEVSVEDIQWAIEEKYGLKITLELIDFPGVHIRGMMERYQSGQANVFVRKNQASDVVVNGYWHRFIAVKEMAHLAIDEKEDWSVDGAETIEDLIDEHEMDRGSPPRDGIQSEVLAEIAAIELLYPWEYRQNDIDSGKTPLELSNIHKVPLYVVQRALSANHMKRARALWNEITARVA
jgi:hypothetical protein